MAVEDAVSAQFSPGIPAFAKPVFEQLRRTQHNAQYFDPGAPPITDADVAWAIGKATEALTGTCQRWTSCETRSADQGLG